MSGEVKCGGYGQTPRAVVEKVGFSWNNMPMTAHDRLRWKFNESWYGHASCSAVEKVGFPI